MALVLFGAILLIFAIGDRLWKRLHLWLEPISHKFALTLFLTLLVSLLAEWLWQKYQKKCAKLAKDAAIIGPEENAVFCGTTSDKKSVFIKSRQRAMHTQVIGTTSAGKTESVILPWAIQDIEQGRGLVLIDGKADRSLLDKLYAYTLKAGRKDHFRLFSLGNIEESHQFNPLIGGTPEEISERVFNSFEFENPYYRSIQFEVFSQIMRVFAAIKEVPTFLKLHQAITDPNALIAKAENVADLELKQWLGCFAGLPASDRMERTSGLTAALSHFAFGKTACLFNTESPAITLDEALKKNLIIYFQLPVLLSPFLGKATGKLILQSLQSAIANRHRGKAAEAKFYSVFLDDFSEYLYPGFVSILNKSRSANIGVVFAHQALGDIKTLGDAIANSILTNANLKIFMRGNDPDSAEYFSKVIGTNKAIKYTERTKRGFWRTKETGDASAREVDEFTIHPNYFKNELGVGEAVMVIPHEAGSRTLTLKFKKYDDIEPQTLGAVPKLMAPGLPPVEKRDAAPKSEVLTHENYENFKNRKNKEIA